MYNLQDIINSNKGTFVDKAVRNQLLQEIDKAVSLRNHLRAHADFYRRQRILDEGIKYPADPEN